MPYWTAEHALLVIAVAVSLQTLLLVAILAAGIVTWRRLRLSVDQQLASATAQLDEILGEVRTASAAISRVTDRASHVIDGAGGVVTSVSSVVAAPKALVLSGASSLLGRLGRWRRAKQAS